MAKTSQTSIVLLLCTIIWTSHFIQGSGIQDAAPYSSNPATKFHLQGIDEKWANRKLAKVMIGSTAPTCTYNECRGCKYKCRAEQVPIEGNDPINSPYRYKCVCLRGI